MAIHCLHTPVSLLVGFGFFPSPHPLRGSVNSLCISYPYMENRQTWLITYLFQRLKPEKGEEFSSMLPMFLRMYRKIQTEKLRNSYAEA